MVIMIPVAIFFAIDRARFTNVIYDVRYVVCMALYITIVFSLITRIIDFILCLFSDTRNMIYDKVTGITHVNMVR